jgi:hypothetical protein
MDPDVIFYNTLLAEFIGDPETSPGIFPGDVQVGAEHPAGAALHTALDSYLNRSAVLGSVGSHRAEVNAGLVLTSLADLRVFDRQMQLLFIGEILEGHKHIIDINIGKLTFEFSFFSCHQSLPFLRYR